MPDKFIQCSVHGRQLWTVVCVHLLRGESNRWLAVYTTQAERDDDNPGWLCGDCLQAADRKELNEDSLIMLCRAHAREVKARVA